MTLCGPFRGRRGRGLRCLSIVAVLVTTTYLYTNAIHQYTNTAYWNREVSSSSTVNSRLMNAGLYPCMVWFPRVRRRYRSRTLP